MSNHQLLLSFLFLPAAWILYGWYCLLLNYLVARKIGVPLVILPISHENPLWMIVDKTFIPLFKSLPFGSGTFTRYNWRGWEFEDKNKSHLELGDVFIAVTPGKNWLYLCNAEALLDVFHRRADFSRPLELLEMLNVFGPNLGTTEGQQWQRHRKITASCFNEQNNDLVWAETVRQARGMLQYWSSTDSVRSTAEDTRVLSLHVLSSAGFGKSYPFESSTAASAATNSASYKQSLQLILDNCILLMVVGQKNLSKSWLPNKWKRIYQATLTFKQYMTEIYEEEKRSMLQGKPESNNLMTSLVRASRDMAGAENEEPRMKDSYSTMNNPAGLTETEIYGNIFVFNFAGHDTTAHTLAYAIVILAAHPEVQDWIAEELQSVLGDQKPEDWSYNGSFPRLKRCLAVLLETVRLYTPVPVAKSTGKQPRTLTVGDKTITIPAHTMVIPSHIALHTHPRYWGPDCLSWRPSRWISAGVNANSSAGAINNPLASEHVKAPHKGSFIAWSEGARNCPGKKFAQVEFVAVMAGLFREWRVEPRLERGEDERMARKRVMRLVESESGHVLLLQMLHPEKAALAWRRR